MCAAIRDALAATFDTDAALRLAVRSSAPDEDAAGQSFAGQLESVLAVAPADVPARVADVWRSAFAPSVEAYRQSQNLEGPPAPPAVIVQEMVDADCAGVAFSAHPTTGQRGLCVVSAVRGVGTTLVDGTETGDTITVERTGAVVSHETAPQHVAHRVDPSAGIRAVPLEDASGVPVLTADQAAEVAHLARRCARHFGRPQDIEWAWADDTLHLLQSRPITRLTGMPDPDAPLRVWDNSNIAESYAGVTTPLTFTFARRAYEGVYRSFLRVMRVSNDVIDARADALGSLIGLLRGRLYYNLRHWYDILSVLPGFRFNRTFMEEMMGVGKALPEDLLPECSTPSLGAKIRDGFRMVALVLRLVLYYRTMDTRVADFSDALDAALQPPAPGLEQMRLDELASFYQTLEDDMLARWDVPIANDFFTMIFFGLSKRAVERWGGAASDCYADLIAAPDAIISTEPARRMRAMAALVAERPTLVETLCTGTSSDIEAALARHPDLRDAFDGYVARFGDRCINELKLESPTVRDDPVPFWRSVGALARRSSVADEAPPEAPGPDPAERLAAARERLADALAGRPLRRRLTHGLLRHARRRIADRENLRFERTRVFGMVRRIFREMGRRLTAHDALDAPQDVFYLEREELLGVVDGTASTSNLRALVAARRDTFAAHRDASPPPDRFCTRGAVHIFDPIPDPAATDPNDTDARDADEVTTGDGAAGTEWTGTGCCPGTVRGPVRVVTDPRAASLDDDAILVARRTDPGWITLLARARGLIVEHGNLLSHAAIVSRELNLPSVVGLPHATERLRDGDVVTLNGQTGTVRRERSA